MNYNTIFMSMLVMACHRAPVFEAKTQLFVQRDGNTNFNGVASMLLTDGDVDCSRFEDGLEDNDMPDTLEDMTGVLIRLAYAFAADDNDEDGEPWTGSFAAYGYFPRISDTGDDETRQASSEWFDAEGLWMNDSSGLRVDIEKYETDKVVGSYEHVWKSDKFKAENCGSYGS